MYLYHRTARIKRIRQRQDIIAFEGRRKCTGKAHNARVKAHIRRMGKIMAILEENGLTVLSSHKLCDEVLQK